MKLWIHVYLLVETLKKKISSILQNNMSQWVVLKELRKHMRVCEMQHYCEIPTPKGTLRGFFHKPNQDKHPVCLIFHGFTGQKTGTKFS